MNFDPQKFFVGLMDFFSILLPGALFTYVVMDRAGPMVLGARYHTLDNAEAWAAFLFSSYLLGHLIFLLGSWLDEFYDWARRRTLNAQIERIARDEPPLHWFVRVLVWLVFRDERDLAVDRAGRIKSQTLGALQAKDAINTFQWCKALLTIESPESLAVVQRFEADSKFFRCLTVVLLLLLALWPLQHRWPIAAIPLVLGLLLLAFWRYLEQRFKATKQAYWSVITLTARNGKISLSKPQPLAGAPERAGGVVFRLRGGQPQYLLVEAAKDREQWVLAKGHVEEGESHREAAIREVHEETGVWACIIADLGNVTYTANGAVITVRFYLMEAIARGRREDKSRRHIWLPLKQALARASHIETRELLQAGEWRRTNLTAGATPAE